MTSTTNRSAPGSQRKISAIQFHDSLIADKGVHDASGFSRRSRTARFDVIQRCLKQFDVRLLLDYGCNDGELFEFLAKKMCPTYVGIDINPKFTRWAKERFREYCSAGSCRFMSGNILEDSVFQKLSRLKPDVIVASGVMSYAGDAQHYPELLFRLFQCAKQGVIVNVLAADVPKHLLVRTKGMVRWQPARIIKLVQACGCESWELIRSYLHNDMTVVMRKKWTHFT